MPEIKIVEVGPRDGLQNEKTPVPTANKLAFVRDLRDAGLEDIEVSSFVSPKWVPQLGDIAELWPELPEGGRYSALVPNEKGLERAIELGVDRIALFTAASDAFTQKNVNMTVAETLDAFARVIAGHRAQFPNGHIRGYVSTIFECPVGGPVSEAKVADVSGQLVELGVDEISLGDTTGVGSPRDTKRVLAAVLSEVPVSKVAVHFHDTRGTALANVAAALEMGVTIVDAAAGGLGGCPYAPGAGGNLATDDLVYFLEREGVATGVDPDRLAQASERIFEVLGRRSISHAQIARVAMRS
ncbi:MAG: hydroxymethylglutaryl-CoA lyase [Chthonomonas sp.]|nr:hydroxymethylglutaryl-CoA lyase [Chthonomonas sp.]